MVITNNKIIIQYIFLYCNRLMQSILKFQDQVFQMLIFKIFFMKTINQNIKLLFSQMVE